MKKTIKLTEKDLTNMIGRIVKETKTKRKGKINESNEHLRSEMEDLMSDASEITESMYQFVKKVNDLHDEIEFDIEDDYVSQSIGDLVYYSDLFYDVLKKSGNDY